LHRFAVVHHRESERQPLAIVPYNLATRQRHGNPRPFETIMRRPVVSVDADPLGLHASRGYAASTALLTACGSAIERNNAFG
jgi:hypothetical protein